MFKFGLKLWSNNDNYISEALRLYEKGIYQYIELYIVPDTFNYYAGKWKDISIPYVIHAPHSGHGMNLAERKCINENILMANEAKKFADILYAEKIIFHPGIGGQINETVFQLAELNEQRAVVENKPYFSIYDKSICNGYSFEDIKYVIENTNVGFCLDISHAIFAANAQKKEPLYCLSLFNSLKPCIYHISDGDYNSVEDKHLNLGDGNFTMSNLITFIKYSNLITVETYKHSKHNLNDFINDIEYLMRIGYEYSLLNK